MSFLYLALYGALTLMTVLPARALDFYVNSSAAVGDDRRSVQSAQDPATPFRTITHALRIAHIVGEGRPHVIRIPAGTYSPSTTGETFPLVISQTRIYIATSGVITFDAEGKSNFFRITAPTPAGQCPGPQTGLALPPAGKSGPLGGPAVLDSLYTRAYILALLSQPRA